MVVDRQHTRRSHRPLSLQEHQPKIPVLRRGPERSQRLPGGLWERSACLHARGQRHHATFPQKLRPKARENGGGGGGWGRHITTHVANSIARIARAKCFELLRRHRPIANARLRLTRQTSTETKERSRHHQVYQVDQQSKMSHAHRHSNISGCSRTTKA